MSKELTEQWRNGTLKDDFYYLQTKDGIIRTDDLVYIVGEKTYRWRYSDICYVQEVLAPVPTYDQFIEPIEKVEELKQQLEYAERTLKNIRILMTCDPSDMKEIDENFCANQLALETVNGYFEKYGVEK